MEPARWWWSTARAPGAIAVMHVDGTPEAVEACLLALCGRTAPGPGEVRLRRFGDVDDGVVARVAAGHALVMPHGGPRIRDRVELLMVAAGAEPADAAAADGAQWPEAADAVERAMLRVLARAESPLAVDLLAAQPARWRAQGVPAAPAERDRRLLRLVDPPRVAVTGPANAGKSTLLNALAGRAVALAHHEPGTTRDAVAARIELAGLVVDWFDTPGVRAGMDRIERAAARLAERALAHADLVVELTAPGLGWSVMQGAPGAVRLRVLNQSDRPDAPGCAERAAARLVVSARTGAGLDLLAAAVRDALVPPEDLASPAPWRFDAAHRGGADTILPPWTPPDS